MWPASPCAVPRHRQLSEPHLTTSQAQGRNELKATEGRGGRAFGKHPQQLLPPPRLSLSYLQPRLSSFLGRTNRGLAGCRQPRNIAEIFRLRSPLEGGSVQGGGTQRVGAPARGGARSSVSAPDIAVDRGRAEGLQVFWEAGRELKIASASRGVRAHRRRGEVWQELLEEGGKGHLIIHQPPPHSPGGTHGEVSPFIWEDWRGVLGEDFWSLLPWRGADAKLGLFLSHRCPQLSRGLKAVKHSTRGGKDLCEPVQSPVFCLHLFSPASLFSL